MGLVEQMLLDPLCRPPARVLRIEQEQSPVRVLQCSAEGGLGKGDEASVAEMRHQITCRQNRIGGMDSSDGTPGLAEH